MLWAHVYESWGEEALPRKDIIPEDKQSHGKTCCFFVSVRLWLFLRSESLRPDAGGSVQVSASVEVDTVPALLCSLSKPQHREQPAHRRDQAPRFTNPDRSVSPKWSQSRSRPTQGHFRQETCMTAYKVLSFVRGILTLSWERCFCRHRLCVGITETFLQNWYNVNH